MDLAVLPTLPGGRAVNAFLRHPPSRDTFISSAALREGRCTPNQPKLRNGRGRLHLPHHRCTSDVMPMYMANAGRLLARCRRGSVVGSAAVTKEFSTMCQISFVAPLVGPRGPSHVVLQQLALNVERWISAAYLCRTSGLERSSSTRT